MGYKSDIEWTETTWNPVTGCTKVSSGCKFCYAERFSERFRGVPNHPFEQGFDLKLHPERLDQPFRWRRPRLVFVNSMSDLFHELIPTHFILQVFEVMRACSEHTFQVLTKRPIQALRFFSETNTVAPENVWVGVSVESQRYSERVNSLRQIPARVRFLSCEPLLGRLRLNLTEIDWVIVGGESGPRSRPVDPSWVRDIRQQCQSRGVPFFFKQWGGRNKKRAGRVLDGRTWDEMPAFYGTGRGSRP